MILRPGQNVGIITKIVQLLIPYSKCGYVGTPGTTGVSKHYITEYAIGNMKIKTVNHRHLNSL